MYSTYTNCLPYIMANIYGIHVASHTDSNQTDLVFPVPEHLTSLIKNSTEYVEKIHTRDYLSTGMITAVVCTAHEHNQ